MKTPLSDNTEAKTDEPVVITEIDTETETVVEKSGSDTIDLGKILSNYIKHWYWFVLSLLICGSLGWFYMHKKSPKYLVKSIIMLNQSDEESNNLSSISSLASQFGIGGSSSGTQSNIYDEMTRLRSDKLLREVVAVCHLNETSWANVGFFKPKAWYYGDSPYSIQVPQQVLDTMSVITKFEITSNTEGNIRLKVKQAKKGVIDTEIKRFPYTARTPAATFVIDTTAYFKPRTDLEFHSMIIGTPLTVYDLTSCLSIDEVDKKGNAIYQDITTTDVRRGEAILNTITSLYSEDRFEQRLRRRKEALAFIDNRLLTLYSELESSENQIEKYKRDNKIVGSTAEAEYIFGRRGVFETASTEARTELEIYTMLRDMLNNSESRYSLLPYAASPDNKESTALSGAVNAYNELILKRMELESGLKGSNSQLERIDEQLNALRSNILTTLTRQIQAKKIALSAVEGEISSSNSRFSEIPSMEKRLTQLYRGREVKSAIYAFLLQKREEAEIAVQKVEPICEVIDPAYSDPEPISPKPMLVYGVAAFMGFLLPLVGVKFFCRDDRKKKKSAAVEA